MAILGRIIEEQKICYVVDTPRGSIRATTRGLLKKDNKRVCVGDVVECELTNSDTGEGIILAVTERETFLNRPPLANITRALLVCTFKEPPLDLEATDRFLLCASAYGVSPVIVFNKMDVIAPADEAPFQEIIAAYKRVPFDVILTSAKTGAGVGDLVAVCKGRLSAFAGLSGVGKSALMQRIFPRREFRTGDLSSSSGRGTHTTTAPTLIPLEEGGYIADTPGIAFVDLPLVPEEDVATYFPELDRLIGKCRFNNCIHENEPGCRVRELVEAGEIAPWRVEHYLKIFREMRTRRREYKRN